MKNNDQTKQQILNLRAKGTKITDIAKIVNKSKSTIYRWIESDDDFAANWDTINRQAMNERAERAEAALVDLMVGRVIELPDEVTTVYDQDGNIITRTVKTGKTVYQKPDVGAIRMTLTNANPAVWDKLAAERNAQAARKLDIEESKVAKMGDMATALEQVLQEYEEGYQDD